MGWYKLDKNRKPIACDILEASTLLDDIKNKVTKKSKFICKKTGATGELSTVFLHLNHGLYSKKPVLFETMIFCDNEDLDMLCFRTTSNKKALRIHNEILRDFRNGHATKYTKEW